MDPFDPLMFPSTVAVQVAGETLSAMGGSSPAPAKPGTSFRASVQSVSAGWQQRMAGQASETIGRALYDVYTPSDLGVIEGDTLAWGSRSLNVLSPSAQDQCGLGVLWRTQCEEIG